MINIPDFLPHCFPFLLIDKVIAYQNNKYLYALTKIANNSFFLNIHYPERPVFPGSIILEIIAQSSGLLEFISNGKLKKNEIYYLYKVNTLNFRCPIFANNILVIKVFVNESRNYITRFKGFITVKDKIVCNFYISCIRKCIY
ncbi:3-hydroxyacyl-ACP dehydratase FabZ family protein [Buchnera aphidicola]|uniref:3-hydroxyacyl-[acyl-carrier-protein] dehydratase FabZ n=1 Tax=Buchnera aphidicola (Anoecia oenotherae) TaxID=1241833 RepID=A0A4D6XQN3_9GAMM|nr:3-hydroxyacyl-[acyl-carrier-protein] dehydratase FabZ [Buchnera aphidicola]QCI19313.1 3-hydroxyacyl-[acyl-carrier-protein] dehydratase FabZ [Buchnera aphidicola (Anoecia oenotherae)]